MKLNLFTTLLTSAALLTTVGLNSISQQAQPQSDTETQFICADSYDAEKGERSPTTFAWTSRGKIAVIRWQSEYFQDWSPQERCNEVSPRFDEAYHNNTLGIITNGTMNNERVICTASESGGACETLLLTLRPEDKSLPILSHFRRLLNAEQVGPVKHSSGEPQIYYQVDIENFLRTSPVEK